VAAFKLTELERDLRRDLLFEPDLGIPLRPWNIEQYSVPEQAPPLHPADAALLAVGGLGGGGGVVGGPPHSS
jgi:RNA polymerase II-associated factor 1